MQTLRDIWAFFEPYAVNIGVSIVSVLSIFGITLKFFGEKIFSHYLDGRLQKLKHEQDKEIEALKAQIGHLSDRWKHSNEREYVALSTIWEKYVELYYATNVCAVQFAQFPNLNVLSDSDVEEFLESTDLSKEQKANVRRAEDKIRSYANAVALRNINKASLVLYEMNLLLHKLGIFIPSTIKDQFVGCVKICSSVIAQQYTEHGTSRTGLTHTSDFIIKGEAYLEGLKGVVRERLLRE
jgi:hypothetical protein